jgi:hypothetical protein
MPLRISSKVLAQKRYSQELYDKILELELAFSDKTDAIALAGHLQAIAYKP